MPIDVSGFIPEIITGLVLGGFAWAFKAWSNSVSEASERILEKLEKLSATFDEHRLKTENRVTKVETEVYTINKRLDRCEIVTKRDRQVGKTWD